MVPVKWTEEMAVYQTADVNVTSKTAIIQQHMYITVTGNITSVVRRRRTRCINSLIERYFRILYKADIVIVRQRS